MYPLKNECCVKVHEDSDSFQGTKKVRNSQRQKKYEMKVVECLFQWEHGVVVRAFGFYWGGSRFESLSNHHCWSLTKSFIISLVVWSMAKNNVFDGEKQKQKEQR